MLFPLLLHRTLQAVRGKAGFSHREIAAKKKKNVVHNASLELDERSEIMELHQLRGNLFINSVNNDHSHSKIQYTYKGAEHIRNYKQST